MSSLRKTNGSEIRAVLFDLDGTLVHSEAVAARSVANVFSQHGVSLDERLAELATGRTWGAAFDLLEKAIALPIPKEELLKEVLQDYRMRMTTEVHPVPGSAAAVQSLASRCRLALVSGSFRQEILFALDQLQISKHFEFILGAEDYPQSKPAPDGYLKALALMQIPAHQALVFEDSEAGIRSALSAGCRVALVHHCRSLPSNSPWLEKVHARLETLEGVSAEWLEQHAF
ncbi:MAG: hypothetical protein RJB38_1151 [Pseudomonadota bacterium]|jgi:HAD superfamily hydrolase (TIGR01509 family)